MATLKNLVDETTNIKNEIVECRDNLKQILVSKQVEGLSNVTKLPNLIEKVNNLIEPSKSISVIYNGDNEYTGITGGWKTHQWDSSYKGGYYNKVGTYLEYGVKYPNNGCGGFITTNPIDLTHFKKIVIDGEIADWMGTGYFRVAICQEFCSFYL